MSVCLIFTDTARERLWQIETGLLQPSCAAAASPSSDIRPLLPLHKCTLPLLRALKSGLDGLKQFTRLQHSRQDVICNALAVTAVTAVTYVLVCMGTLVHYRATADVDFDQVTPPLTESLVDGTQGLLLGLHNRACNSKRTGLHLSMNLMPGS